MTKEEKNKHNHLENGKLKEHTKKAYAKHDATEKKLEHKEHKDSVCGTNSYCKD